MVLQQGGVYMEKKIKLIIILTASIIGALVGFFAVTYLDWGTETVFYGGLFGAWLGAYIYNRTKK